MPARAPERRQNPSQRFEAVARIEAAFGAPARSPPSTCESGVGAWRAFVTAPVTRLLRPQVTAAADIEARLPRMFRHGRLATRPGVEGWSRSPLGTSRATAGAS